MRDDLFDDPGPAEQREQRLAEQMVDGLSGYDERARRDRLAPDRRPSVRVHLPATCTVIGCPRCAGAWETPYQRNAR